MSYRMNLLMVISITLTMMWATRGNPIQAMSTWDCGPTDKIVHFPSAAISPSPVPYPGSVKINAIMEVLQDLPSSGLRVKIRMSKLEPETMIVPCMGGVGSCDYDVCDDLIKKNSGLFNALDVMSCPIKKMVYRATSLPYDLPVLGGPVFAQVLEGNFKGNLTFYNNETKKVYGCLGMEFGVIAKK